MKSQAGNIESALQKPQVSKGNGHYGQLQGLEEEFSVLFFFAFSLKDIRRFQDEAELLTLGLHEARPFADVKEFQAEHRKTYLLQDSLRSFKPFWRLIEPLHL